MAARFRFRRRLRRLCPPWVGICVGEDEFGLMQLRLGAILAVISCVAFVRAWPSRSLVIVIELVLNVDHDKIAKKSSRNICVLFRDHLPSHPPSTTQSTPLICPPAHPSPPGDPAASKGLPASSATSPFGRASSTTAPWTSSRWRCTRISPCLGSRPRTASVGLSAEHWWVTRAYGCGLVWIESVGIGFSLFCVCPPAFISAHMPRMPTFSESQPPPPPAQTSCATSGIAASLR